MVGRMVALMFVTWAGLTIGQSSIEALLFSRYGVDELPVLYLLLGLLLFLASLGVTALLGRMAREKLFVLMPLVLAALLVAGRLAVEAGIELVYPALWLFANLALLAQGLYLWGIAGLVTDTRQAKRLFPLFAAGGIAGAAVGGLVTGPLAGWLQPENLLLLWSGILVASTALARAVVGRWEPGRGRAPRRRRDRVTALGAIRQGYRTVRGSALLRWMSAGAVLFSVLLYSLYLPFSRAAVDRFPDAGELAGFLGVFSGVSTAVALVVSLVAANRLFSRFGTPSILLAYTIAYALGFAVLAVNGSLAVLVLVRFVQVVGMQGLANSAWEAMINVTPPERRDQARAFLNGVPAQAGTALAGLVLILGQRSLQPRQLFLVGFGAAVLTALTMWQARRSYAAAVAETLRAGRPHVFDDGQAEAFTGVREDAAAVSVAVAALSDTDPRVRRVAAEILGGLRNRELVTPLSASLGDPDAGVRVASVRALARLGDPSAVPGLSGRLADADAAVRLAAVQAMRSFDGPAPLVPMLDDPDPAVRAETAAGQLAGDGTDRAAGVLRELISEEDPELRRIAVRALGHAQGATAAALAAGRLDDPDPSVRAAAAEALADVDPEHAVARLVETLSDPDSAVRAAAAHALGRIGRPAVPAVAMALEHPETESGALLALERLPTDGHVDRVRRNARESVNSALRDHRQAARLAGATDDLRRLLHDALARSAEQNALNAVRAVAVLSDRSLLGEAVGNLGTADSAQRAAAVELIDSSREASFLRPLLAIWEPGHGPPMMPVDPVPELLSHPDPWIRRCAEFAVSTSVEGDPMARTLPTLAVIERVLLLRKVPILDGLPPEDLERIAAVAEEHAYSDGDVIAAQGETGTETHIIVSGMVGVVANGRGVARRGSGDVVGEMAVITGLPRSATLLASGDVRLLTIGQRQFAGILRERPETGMAVMQVLARRLAERETSAI
jgi:HEAT repeat protein